MDGKDGITLSERLARFVSALRYEDLPPQVVARAKSAVLDTLGAGLAGARTSEVARVIASVRDCGRGGTATIWGADVRSAVTGAALINGTMAHSRELDDYGGCGHSGAVVVPAALAAGEHEAVSGKALLTAVVVGYDVAARVTEAAGGYRPHNARGWHSTGTCGSFGAAAAAAKCLGLDAAGTAAALGIAGSYTGGLWAFIVDGAMTKRLHPGKAAENGVFAAYLARHGFTGPAEILEAEWGGFLGTYAQGDANASACTSGLGTTFKIMDAAVKPYACCAAIHAPLGALLDLVAQHGLVADQIERVTVRGTSRAVRQLGKQDVATTLDAQMSLPYSFAVALSAGRASPAEYEDRWLHDDRVRDLVSRIAIVADAQLGDESPKEVEVLTRDGQRLAGSAPFAKGHPRNPLSAQEIAEKFGQLAAPVLRPEGAARVRAAVESLEDAPSLGPLMAALAARN